LLLMSIVRSVRRGATRASEQHASLHLLPRKQPRQAWSVALVEAILGASTRIIEERSTADFTTNAVVDRAGISIGSLYQYFRAATPSAIECRSSAGRSWTMHYGDSTREQKSARKSPQQ